MATRENLVDSLKKLCQVKESYQKSLDQAQENYDAFDTSLEDFDTELLQKANSTEELTAGFKTILKTYKELQKFRLGESSELLIDDNTFSHYYSLEYLIEFFLNNVLENSSLTEKLSEKYDINYDIFNDDFLLNYFVYHLDEENVYYFSFKGDEGKEQFNFYKSSHKNFKKKYLSEVHEEDFWILKPKVRSCMICNRDIKDIEISVKTGGDKCICMRCWNK